MGEGLPCCINQDHIYKVKVTVQSLTIWSIVNVHGLSNMCNAYIGDMISFGKYSCLRCVLPNILVGFTYLPFCLTNLDINQAMKRPKTQATLWIGRLYICHILNRIFFSQKQWLLPIYSYMLENKWGQNICFCHYLSNITPQMPFLLLIEQICEHNFIQWLNDCIAT